MFMRFVGATLIAMLLAPFGSAQVAKKANEGYQTEEQRARVARALADPEREDRDKPSELLAELDIEEGMTVADIGSGVGFMLPYFVDLVGKSGKVYAEDIQQDFLDKIQEAAAENGWSNVETVLGDQRDPKLPEGEIDLAFIQDAYHHFEYPQETVGSILKSLKPGGRLVVVDFYRSRPHPRWSPERLEEHIRKDRDGFAAEIEEAGFRLIRHFDHMPHQYVMIFTQRNP